MTDWVLQKAGSNRELLETVKVTLETLQGKEILPWRRIITEETMYNGSEVPVLRQ